MHRMRKTTLVVDDDPLYLDLVRDVLAVQEIEALSALSVAEALTLLKTASPTFIVSDFEMPDMDGLAFHEHLQQHQKTKDIPFVFMTGSSDTRLLEYVRQHNISMFSKNNLVKELIRLSNDLK